jgi:preprotein translocase subunit SecA
MEIDNDKIDEAVLALMWLTVHDKRRAWKSFAWAATSRLYQKGFIRDPASKAKSIVLTDEGLQKAEELFKAMFTRQP